jgi:hypothetical protein
MKTNKKGRRQIAVWLWFTVGLLVGLAGGLPRLTLDDGSAYAGEWIRPTAIGNVNMQPFALFSLFFISVIVLMYMRQRSWRSLWSSFLVLFLLCGALMAVVSLFPVVEFEEPAEEETAVVVEEEEEENGLETGDQLPPPEAIVVVEPYQPPPAWVGLVVSVLLTFFALVTLISFYWYYIYMISQPLTPEDMEEPLDQVVRPAQLALASLRQGKPLADVVLRCYADMEQTLRTTRGIERRQAMTVREFEQQLFQIGLPVQAVTTLTRLFEAVRYGRYTPQPEDQSLAVHSLTQIVAASKVD